MGVNGLWTLISPVARPIKLETMGNKRLAIDSSIWLYQFQNAMRDREGRALVNAHILGFLRRICKLLYYGIKPVFVFDGGAPVLKRMTIGERKKRKRGGQENLAKTAEKLLAAQMRQVAVKEAQRRAQETDTGDVIADDAHYLGDEEDFNNVNVIRRGDRPAAASPSTSAQPAAKSQSPEVPKKKKYVPKDQYALPTLDEPIQAAASTRSDPRLATEAELRDFIDDMRPEDFDISSPLFASLPTEVKYEIIGDLRIKSRQANRRRVEEMRSAPTALDFSRAQIRNLMERNDLTQKLLDVTDMVSKANLTIPVKIAGQRNKEYVLVKNAAEAGGGWVLGVRDGVTTDPNAAGTSRARAIRVGEGDSATDDHSTDGGTSTDEFEEVGIPNHPKIRQKSATPDAEHRHRQTMRAIQQRYGAPLPDDQGPFDPDLDVLVDAGSGGAASLFQPDEAFFAPETNRGEGGSKQAGRSDGDGDGDSEEEQVLREIAVALKRHDREMEERQRGEKQEEVEGRAQDSSDEAEIDEVVAGPPISRSTPPRTDAGAGAPSAVARALEMEDGSSDEGESDFEEIRPGDAVGRPDALVAPSRAAQGAAPELTQSLASVEPAVDGRMLAKERLKAKAAEVAKLLPSAVRPPLPAPARLQTNGRPSLRPSTPTNDHQEKASVSETDTDTYRSAKRPKTTTAEAADDVTVKDFARAPARPVAPPAAVPTIEEEREPNIEQEAEPSQDRLASDALEKMGRHPSEALQDDIPWSPSPEPEPRAPAPEAMSVEEAIKDFPLAEPGHELSEDEQLPDEEAEAAANLQDEATNWHDFLSQLQNRNLDDLRAEVDAEVRQLTDQRTKDRRGADDITVQMAKEIQVMLRLFGIPYVVAPMEAEAQCAELLSRSLVDGIITDDSDVFLFGGSRIYKNMFNQNKYVECYLLSDLERELSLDREKLVRLAYLLGSDYVDGLPGVGPVSAMEVMREFPGTDGLMGFREWWRKVQTGRDGKTDNPTPFKRKFRKNKDRIWLDEGWPNPAVLDAYYHPTVDESDQRFSWGIPDLDGLRQFLMEHLSWSSNKTDDLLIPLIKRQTQRIGGIAHTQGVLDGFFDISAGSGTYAPRQRTGYSSQRLQNIVREWREAQKKQKEAEAAAQAGRGDESGEEDEGQGAGPGREETLGKRQAKVKPVVRRLPGPSPTVADHHDGEEATPEPPKRKKRARTGSSAAALAEAVVSSTVGGSRKPKKRRPKDWAIASAPGGGGSDGGAGAGRTKKKRVSFAYQPGDSEDEGPEQSDGSGNDEYVEATAKRGRKRQGKGKARAG